MPSKLALTLKKQNESWPIVRSRETIRVQDQELLVILAALREELAPLRSILRAKKIYVHHKQIFYKTTLGGKDCLLVQTGMGPANVAKAIRFLEKIGRSKSVINVGFAGALSRELLLGDVVYVSKAVNWPSCETIQLATLCDSGIKAGSIHVIGDATCLTVPKMLSKKKMARLSFLRNKKAVVDLETYHYARVCRERGIPLVVLRGITDVLDDRFLFALEDIADKHGHVDPLRALKNALIKPSLVPHFWKLWRVSSMAAENMAKALISLVGNI